MMGYEAPRKSWWKKREIYTGEYHKDFCSRDMICTFSAVVKVNRLGAHTLMLAFDKSKDKQRLPNRASAIISGLSFIIPNDYASCQDTKVCLEALGKNGPARRLRASNQMQKLCLMEDMDTMTRQEKDICEQWRRCLQENGNHLGELLELLHAAGVEQHEGEQRSQIAIRSGDDKPVVVMCRLDRSMEPLGVSSPHGRKHPAGYKTCKTSSEATKLGVFTGAKIPGHNQHSCAKACLERAACLFAMFKVHTGECVYFADHTDCESLVSTKYESEVYVKTSQAICDSMREVNSVPRDFTPGCINPLTADPESWDCDCFEEMHRLCKEIVSVHKVVGFSTTVCLRAQICSNPMVCGDWKATQCGTAAVKNLQQILDDLYNRDATTELSQSMNATLDESNDQMWSALVQRSLHRSDGVAESLESTMAFAKRCK
eukprot:gnl/TRDRNA2_/TRDRNA2_116500_c0_seq1.p1 gnl/TRDRNA2_/TRDRNA2_116500_c0~~gnl/TRDRNA2_/TRDRNA2_116500_c0_seq1.p1  ORF type:complete len:482 (-),score=40.32 gnl/TRDRNA2_/TRDRNA2_116500_c0_seq1:303-1592(-)